MAPSKAEAQGPMDFESLLFAGTAKATVAPPVAIPAPTAPAAKAPQPPPPSGASPPIDLLGGGAAIASSAPAPMGGFDPFASSSTPAVGLGSGGFDPFQNMGATAAPANMSGPFGSMGGQLGSTSGPANLSGLL